MTTEDIPELTDADFASALSAADFNRMRAGLFQPGDIEKLTQFVRLTPDQMRVACGDFSPLELAQMDRTLNFAGILHEMLRRLLRVAVLSPGTFRRLVLPGTPPAEFTKPTPPG